MVTSRHLAAALLEEICPPSILFEDTAVPFRGTCGKPAWSTTGRRHRVEVCRAWTTKPASENTSPSHTSSYKNLCQQLIAASRLTQQRSEQRTEAWPSAALAEMVVATASGGSDLGSCGFAHPRILVPGEWRQCGMRMQHPKPLTDVGTGPSMSIQMAIPPLNMGRLRLRTRLN